MKNVSGSAGGWLVEPTTKQKNHVEPETKKYTTKQIEQKRISAVKTMDVLINILAEYYVMEPKKETYDAQIMLNTLDKLLN